jgi:tetratricopeptide (TPR) repeat protein
MHTLPRDTVAFTGREDEIDALVHNVMAAIASSHIIAIHAIDGMAGIGKTALAVHVGHILQSRFPDGQYFLRLHAHTPGKKPVETEDALGSLLTADGVLPQDIPTGIDARSALWRSRLAGRQTLVILDDAVGYDHVKHLIPSASGCLVIITSRRRMAALDAAISIPLDVLKPAKAAELFARLSGRQLDREDAEPVAQLVQLCGYLPLAISLLAGRLRHRPAWTVADLASDLRVTQDRLGELQAEGITVEAALEMSYNDLHAGQKLVFRYLGMHPGTEFDAYAAVALSNLDLPAVESCLSGLYDVHVLDEPVRGRYLMHDLIREYAGKVSNQLDHVERMAALQRLFDYYLVVAQTAGSRIAHTGATPAAEITSQLTVPELATQDAAVQWFRAERASLLACVDLADAEHRYPLVVNLASAMAGFMRHAGPWEEAVRLHRKAVEAAERTADRAGQAEALVNVGIIAFLRGDYPDARAALTRSLELYQEIDDPPGRAHALAQMGTFQRLTGNFEAAIDAQSQALEIYRALDDRSGQAYVLTELGTVHPMVGDYSQANRALSQALDLSRELGDRLAEAYALNELGTIRPLIGDYPGAVTVLAQSLEIARELRDNFAEAFALNELGNVRRLTGDYGDAAEASSRALDIYRELGSQLGEADALNRLGRLAGQMGRYGDAEDALRRAHSICSALEDRLGQASALNALGDVLRLAGNHSSARTATTEALALYQDLGHRLGEAEATNTLAALLLETEGPAAAQARYSVALDLAREARSPLEEARALEGLATATSDDEVLRQAKAIYRRIGSPQAREIR